MSRSRLRKRRIKTEVSFLTVGILRDVAQNHLMQLIAAIAMESPVSFTEEDLRDARANAIKSIVPIEPDKITSNVVRGQYEDYHSEKDVLPNSETETLRHSSFL